MVLLLLFVLVFAVSNVSASDELNSNATVSESIDTDIDSNSQDNLMQSSSSEEDVLSEDSGTFTDLQNDINAAGDYLALNKSYFYDASVDSSYLAGITINKKLTIDGNFHTINGSNLARIFKITGDNVFLENINFTNAYRSDGTVSAAIYWKGNNGTVQNCNFIDNLQDISLTTDGMCIACYGQNYTIKECNFKTSQSVLDEDTTHALYATCLYFEKSYDVSISYCNFSGFTRYVLFKTGNSATFVHNNLTNLYNLQGAGYQAIYFEYVPQVLIDHNYFNTRVSDSSHAGNIRALYASVVNFTNNYCYNLRARGELVAFVASDFINVINNIFDTCTHSVSGQTYKFGGYLTQPDVLVANNYYYKNVGTQTLFTIGDTFNTIGLNRFEMYNATFDSCSGSNYAGEVALFNVLHVNNASFHNITFKSCTFKVFRFYNIIELSVYNISFINCYSSAVNNAYYGVLFNIASCNYVNIENNTVSNCYSNLNKYATYGTMLHAENSNVNFHGNNFTGCYDKITLRGAYGMLYFENGEFNITNNNFIDNKVTGLVATGIIDCKADNARIENNTFKGNRVTGDGGDVYNIGDDVNILYNNFTSEYASGSGGSIYNLGDNMNILYNNFTGIHADSNGGVIYSDSDSITIMNNNMNNCYAIGDGGALYIIGDNANIMFNNFTGIHADRYGVLYCDSIDSIIYNNTYVNNYANSDAIFAIGSGSTIYNETFINSTVNNGQAGTILFLGSTNILSNSTIINSDATAGGAIVNNGDYNTIENIPINNTRAFSTYGGAIYSIGNYFTINNVNITNASALNDGGAIYSTGDYCSLYHVNLINVSSEHDGGAIYWTGENGNGYDINITNANATRNGGAINWIGSYGSLSLVNIINSTAGGDGGAIYWTGYEGKIYNLTVSGNVHATNGGAVAWRGQVGTIDEASFSNIYATGYGGAIYWTGSDATLRLINFTHINSTADGGAIYGTGTDSTMDTLIFNDTCSTANGGAISWSGSNTNAVGLIFANIYANNYGGAVFWTGDKSSIKKSKFEDIAAESNGGAVYWTGSTGALEDVNFTNISARGGGGAIYWLGDGGNVSIANFNNNTASIGGAISWNADNGELSYATFTGNNASSNGGAVNWIGESTKLHDLNISDNNATFKGGAIYVSGTNAILYNLYIVNNTAGTDGGAINLDGSNVKLYNSTFIDNEATANGGALAWFGSDGECYNNTFVRNDGGIGGAVYINSDNNQFYYLNISNNTANIGGAIYITGVYNNKLSDSILTSNSATDSGGAIYCSCDESTLSNVTIMNSHATDGGAIYWSGSDGVLSNLTFNNNSALDNGGIFYISGSNVTVANTPLNHANATNGGVGYWTGHMGKLENVSFENNTVTNNGACLYIVGSNFEIVNANFTYNNASNYGGAIYCVGSGSISNSNFTYNQAYGGSAIYNAGNIYISNTTILNNKANISSISIEKTEPSRVYFYIDAVLRGNDNFLNGIWTTSDNIHVNNVTYWDGYAENVTNQNDEFVTPVEGVSETELYFDSRLDGFTLNITVKKEGSEELSSENLTDIYGHYSVQFPADPGFYNFTVRSFDNPYYFGFSSLLQDYVGADTPTLSVRLSSMEFYYNSVVTMLVIFTVQSANKTDITPNESNMSVFVDDDWFFNMTLLTSDPLSGYKDVVFPVSAGRHNVTVWYGGQSNPPIDSISTTVNFIVERIPIDIPVSTNVSTVYVDDLINITILPPDIYHGDVSYVAGIYRDTFEANGEYSFDASYPEAGTITVIAYAEGDENYLPGIGNCTFNVIKRDAMISYENIEGIYLNPINVGDPAVITVKFNVTDATGNVIITIDDKDYTAVVDGEYATVTVYNLTSDSSIVARYEGDRKYNSYGSIRAVLPVNKIDVNITVSPTSFDINVGDNATFKINVSAGNYSVNGFVTANIKDKSYNVSIVDNIGYLLVNGLGDGNHTINIIYSGDNQFNSAFNNESFIIVNKIDISDIIVSLIESNLVVGENATLNIKVTPSIVGYVTIAVDDDMYNVSITEGIGSLVVYGLMNGTHNVDVFYGGDNKYRDYAKHNAASINVEKIDIDSINVVVDSPIFVGDNATFNITVNPEKFVVNDRVIVNINNKNYSVMITDNKGSLSVYDLNEGTYDVSIFYSGDNQFKNYSDLFDNILTVNRIDISTIKVTHNPEFAYVGQDVILNINMTPAVNRSSVNGFVTVAVGNDKYNVSIINNIGSLTLSNLNNGSYAVNVSYAGDNVYKSKDATNADTIVVNKVNIGDIAITLNSQNVPVAGNAVINITITPEIDGYLFDNILTVHIGNKSYDVSINNGVGLLNATMLNNGTFDINVSYGGDNVYNSLSTGNIASVTVDKVNIDSIVLTPKTQVIHVYENATIDVEVVPQISGYMFNGYITIILDNREYSVSIRDNKGSITIYALNRNDTYDVNASFDGNDMYNPKSSEKLASITVNKWDISSIVAAPEKSPVYVGDDAIINIDVNPSNLEFMFNGYVNVTVNNNKYNVYIIDNEGSLIINNLTEGNYGVNVSFDGNDMFNSKEDRRLTSISVIKINIDSIVVDPNNQSISVGDDAKLKISMISENGYLVNDFVVVNIAGEDYIVSIINSSGLLTVRNLDKGIYAVNVIYNGNDMFNSISCSKIANITVNKINIQKITVLPESQHINVSDDANIKINVVSNSSYLVNGSVTVKVAGEEYVVSIINGVGLLTISNLLQGNYSIDVYYAGDNQFNNYSSIDAAEINVTKINLKNITVTAVDASITVGDEAVFIVDVYSDKYLFNDYVTVNVADKEYKVTVSNNRGYLTIPDLYESVHNVDIIYAGNNQFNAYSKSNPVTKIVNKVNIDEMRIVPLNYNINVGDDAEFNITLTAGTYVINGYVTVTINNKNYTVPIIENNGSLIVTGLQEGEYKVNVSYLGDYQFNPKEIINKDGVSVEKIDLNSIDIDVDSSIYVGQNALINITLNPVKSVVNGHVTLKINNANYTVPISDNKGSISIPSLSNGTYDIIVVYGGDNQFNNKSSTASLIVVNKISTSINVSNVKINVGDVANIIAVINSSDVTGNVTFIVDNKEYVVGIIGGVSRLNISNLNTSANKTITAKYSGNYKYENSTATALLNVTKVQGNASITVYNITAGETETIIIKLPNDVTNATITVKFNGVKTNYTINNNVISFNRTLQVSGNYSVTISVVDDCKYYDFNNSTIFTVFKVAPENYVISIDVNNTKVFEEIPIIVNLPSDANETLSLMVDNKTIGNIPVNNSVASHTLGNLSSGNHTITVTYGNDKYDTKTVSANVFVSKIASSINITNPVDPRVAHDIIITLTPEPLSNGNITVTINGKEYSVEEGFIVNASDLLEGDYTVIAVLAEDDNFFASTNNSIFTVNKNPVSITLKDIVEEIRVNNPVTLHVDLTENATGSVVFNINGENFTVNITESNMAEYIWTPAADGVVSISASYLGSYIYYANSTDTIAVDVYKNPIKFNNITVNDIKVEDIENIIVILNESDATGLITIDINGSKYESSVVEGRAVFDVSALPAGIYNAIASYGGDFKYLATNAISSQFIVSKYDAPVIITADDIMVLDDALIIVNVWDDASGHISITVDNKSIYLPIVDGHVSWNISNLSAGVYEVNAEYSGNYKYSSNSSSGTFNVNRYNSTFEITREDAGWTGEDINMSVKLSDDATGNVAVNVNGTEYVLPVNDGKVDFTIPMLESGDYKIIVTYSGDYKYDDVSDVFNFTVNSNYPIIESDDVVKYYKGSQRLYVNLTNVRGDKLAGETLYVTINGVIYSRSTNANGTFSLPINLPSGEYSISIIYNSSELYDSVSKVVNVTVLPTVEGEDLVKVFCNDSQYWAHFVDSEGNDLANTVVSFNINGVFYNRMTNESGWAKLNINLPAGEYIITAYNPVTDEKHSNNITVLSRIVENYDISKIYRDPTKFTVRIIGDNGEPIGEGAKVEFNINGVLYTRATNSEGYAGLNINLPPGQYIITTNYNGCTVSNTITVLERD